MDLFPFIKHGTEQRSSVSDQQRLLLFPHSLVVYFRIRTLDSSVAIDPVKTIKLLDRYFFTLMSFSRAD